MHNFFTKYNKSENQIFVSVTDIDKYVSEYDLSSKGKKTQYKGVPKYDFKRINLFPFQVKIDFSMNGFWADDKEKKRLFVPKSYHGKNMVDLIAIYEKIESKGCGQYSTCFGGGLSKHKILCKQRGLRGSLGYFFYEANDKDVIEYFKSRGFKVEKKSNGQEHRISFVKYPNTEEEANRVFEDVYEFDQKFKRPKK